MSGTEQIVALEADLKALIHRYRMEFDMAYAAVIGVLSMEVMSLHREACENQNDDE